MFIRWIYTQRATSPNFCKNFSWKSIFPLFWSLTFSCRVCFSLRIHFNRISALKRFNRWSIITEKTGNPINLLLCAPHTCCVCYLSYLIVVNGIESICFFIFLLTFVYLAKKSYRQIKTQVVNREIKKVCSCRKISKWRHFNATEIWFKFECSYHDFYYYFLIYGNNFFTVFVVVFSKI